jgi:hypothetical protein
MNVPDHLPQFDEKFVGVQQFGHDQAAIEWGLNPPAGEHHGFKHVLDAAYGRVALRDRYGL